MKRQILPGLLVLVSLFFAGFTAKAQLDTAWLAYNYTDQYIYPPIADSAYERWNLGVYTRSPMDAMFAIDADNDTNCITEIAQRFEVRDSVKIMGAALCVMYMPALQGFDCDTATVEVWDENLINTLYSKTFIVGGIGEGVQIIGLSGFVEVLFDDTITLYNDYYVSIRNSIPCDNNRLAYAAWTQFNFIHMVHYASDGTSCTPYACRTKYKPYVKMCKVNPETGRDVISPWTYIEDIPTWTTQSYDYVASYYRPAGCDTIVNAPMGICPIKVFEDTVSQDTTSSGVLSVELLEKAVRVYPNPANEILNVACDYDIEGVAVFDVQNRLVEERKVNSKTLQLPLANYAQGTYFITITTEKGKLNKKFVVQ
ncbi:MAG: T9SS type A sorting domain-containing protein [Candidatus Onthomorpha sp.]